MGKTKTPGVLPKRKPKATATSTNRKTGATRGVGDADDMDYMRKAAAANMMYGGKVKKMEEGGNVISDADRARIAEISGSMSFPKLGRAKAISDADKARMSDLIGAQKRKDRKSRPLPSGASLSDADREKIMRLTGMEDGGEVRGMGRAYQGKPRSCKVR